jgi:hypothetical protein
LEQADAVTPVEETGAGDEDEGNGREPGLAEDLGESGHEDPAQGKREAGPEVPAGEKESADQGEAAEDRPEGEAGDGRDLEGAALAGGGGDFDLVPFPAKGDPGGRFGVSGLESGDGGRGMAVGIVEDDGGMARRCGCGRAAAGSRQEGTKEEQPLHGSSVAGSGVPDETKSLRDVPGFYGAGCVREIAALAKVSWRTH